MLQNPLDFANLTRAFNENGLPFVVVGGLAMVFHGSDIVTVDTDFAVANDPSATDPIVKALAPFNPKPYHYPDGNLFVGDSRSVFGTVISLKTDVGEVDLMRELPGVDSFEGLWSRSIELRVFDVDIRVASIEDMIAMKKAANRPKDQNHLMELESIAALRGQEREE